MTLTPVRDSARGKWRGILCALGVEARYLTGKNTPCPICRDRKPRFRFTDRNGDGMWICTHCGAHDGFTLLMTLHGKDFKQVAEDVESVIGAIKPERSRPERSDAEKHADMIQLWRSGRRVTVGDPAGLYLRRRTGLVSFPTVLRFAKDNLWTSGYPAMLAKVSGLDGSSVQLHRTLLTEDGGKASLDNPRRMMPGSVPKGSAVRLFDAAEHLGVAEGIETALSASSLFSVPCWAALNAGMLEAWAPPDIVKQVTVFGDNDASFTGQYAAFALARKLRVAGLIVDVKIPETIGHDWNDVLMASMNEGVVA